MMKNKNSSLIEYNKEVAKLRNKYNYHNIENEEEREEIKLKLEVFCKPKKIKTKLNLKVSCINQN